MRSKQQNFLVPQSGDQQSEDKGSWAGVFTEACRGGSCLPLPALGVPTALGVPWLVDTPPQSLPTWSPGLLPVPLPSPTGQQSCWIGAYSAEVGSRLSSSHLQSPCPQRSPCARSWARGLGLNISICRVTVHSTGASERTWGLRVYFG